MKKILFSGWIFFHTLINLSGQIRIEKFNPVRTVLKPGKDIPFYALVHNNGNRQADVHVELSLPSNTHVTNGNTVADIRIQPHRTDSLVWHITFDNTGTYRLNLLCRENGRRVEKTYIARVTYRYWRQKHFLLSAYNPPFAYHGPPFTDTVFTYYRNAGFDNFLWARDNRQLIRKIKQYGFTYLLDISSFFDEEQLRGAPDSIPAPLTQTQLQSLDSLVREHQNDPALIGYYICDEPYESGFDNIAAVMHTIRHRDPERFCFVNLWPYFPGDPEGTDRYIEHFLEKTGAQILSYDRYLFYNDGPDSSAYFDQIQRIRREALKYDVPFCNIIQAVGTNGTSVGTPGGGPEYLNWRTPTEAEHRWLVYTSLTYGVHALVWFHWDCCDWGVMQNPARDTIYPSIRKINTEIDSLKEIMLRLRTKTVYHWHHGHIERLTDSLESLWIPRDNTALIVGTFADTTGTEHYVMLTNLDFTAGISTTIQTNLFLQQLEVFDTQQNQWQSIRFDNTPQGSRFLLQLRKGEGKLFRFSGTKVSALKNDIQNTFIS